MKICCAGSFDIPEYTTFLSKSANRHILIDLRREPDPGSVLGADTAHDLQPSRDLSWLIASHL